MPANHKAAVRSVENSAHWTRTGLRDVIVAEVTREYTPLVEAAQKITWVADGQGGQCAYYISSEDIERLRAALEETV